MRQFQFVIALLMLAGLTALVHGEEMTASYCGDQGVMCGDTERCCEHVVAYFSDDGATAPSYVEGQCIPHEQKCGDFWCGNRHCQKGFFGAPEVCCIHSHPGSNTEYQCAYSELSCPGNTQQLSIREKDVASRTLAATKAD